MINTYGMLFRERIVASLSSRDLPQTQQGFCFKRGTRGGGRPSNFLLTHRSAIGLRALE